MKFSEAIDALGQGLIVQHETWEPTSKLWYDEAHDVFRVSTVRGDFVWVPQSFDLLSRGWRLCAPTHAMEPAEA